MSINITCPACGTRGTGSIPEAPYAIHLVCKNDDCRVIKFEVRAA